jgi:transposase
VVNSIPYFDPVLGSPMPFCYCPPISDGRSLCCELWPGNTTDVKTLVPIADRLEKRFAIGEIFLLADRWMISQGTIKELEAQGWQYILGARMRRQKEVSKEVFSRGGRFRVAQVKGKRKKDPSPLQVKQVMIDDRRYIVCRNEDQAKKDAAYREAIISALKEKLKQGDKAFVGNKGYRKYIQTRENDSFWMKRKSRQRRALTGNGYWEKHFKIG